MSDKMPQDPVFDDDNPEWTDADFARAKPLSAFPELEKAFRKVGRPSQDKQLVSLRIDRAVLDLFKAGGPGWQTRINEVLKRSFG